MSPHKGFPKKNKLDVRNCRILHMVIEYKISGIDRKNYRSIK